MRQRGPPRGPVRLRLLPRVAGHVVRGGHARSCSSAFAAAGLLRLFHGSRRRHQHASLLFLDAGRLAGQGAQVIELGLTDATAADHLDVADHRAMHREDALDTNTVRDLANRERLADTAATTGDANALERLNAFLVAFLHAYVDAQRVAGAEWRQIAAQPSLLSFDERMHGT